MPAHVRVTELGRRRNQLARLGRRTAMAIALSPLALAFVQLTTGVFSRATWMPLWKSTLTGSIIGGVTLMILSAILYGVTGLSRHAGELTVERGTLDAERDDDTRLATQEKPTSGIVVPLGRGARVEVELQGGDTVFGTVSSVAAADETLDALGIGPSERITKVSSASSMAATLRALGASVGGVFGSTMALGFGINAYGTLPTWLIPAWLVLTALVAFGLVRATRPSSVEIGADGVAFHTLLGKRYIPYAKVKSLRRVGKKVGLEVDGEVTWMTTESPEIAHAVEHRIEDVRGEVGLVHRSAFLAELAPRGRPVAQLRRDLRAWVVGGSAFRSAVPSREELSKVLVDAAQPSGVRVGAALALRTIGGEETERIRIAAEASVDPRLRIAFETVSSETEDDEAIERALAELEAKDAEDAAAVAKDAQALNEAKVAEDASGATRAPPS